MDQTIRITIRVRKYLWKEFVYDICYAIYAAYMITRALSRRFLLPIFLQTHTAAARIFSLLHSFLSYSVFLPLFLFVGVIGMIYTVSIPVILLLAALGKAQ